MNKTRSVYLGPQREFAEAAASPATQGPLGRGRAAGAASGFPSHSLWGPCPHHPVCSRLPGFFPDGRLLSLCLARRLKQHVARQALKRGKFPEDTPEARRLEVLWVWGEGTLSWGRAECRQGTGPGSRRRSPDPDPWPTPGRQDWYTWRHMSCPPRALGVRRPQLRGLRRSLSQGPKPES